MKDSIMISGLLALGIILTHLGVVVCCHFHMACSSELITYWKIVP
jgi:hypothetical protein